MEKHYHEDNCCCFCGAEDSHECLDCPDIDLGDEWTKLDNSES